ncbi:MAG: non-homologous end-joining DNA ligase [Myxococcota bacterium]
MPARGKKEKGPPRPPTGARHLAAQHRLSSLEAASPEQEQSLAADRSGWLFEVFWDGYRVTATRFGDEVRLFSDDLREWTQPAAAIALSLKDLPALQLALEGTLCVLDERGRPDFEALRTRITTGKGGALVFMVSDCLFLDGPLTELPLSERRGRLERLLPAGHRALTLSAALDGSLVQVRETLAGLELPGLVARPLTGPREGLVISADDEPVPINRSLSAAPRVTNQTKVLFPRDGFTKDDLVGWYRDVAPVLLAHMRGRPVVAQRWPDGIDDFTWFQHRAPPRAPDYVKSVRIEGDRRILIDNEDALLWMANQAALTFHGWASRVGSLQHPDWAIIDLDPGTSTTWPQVIEVATAVRALLELLGVASVVKTSGQKGLHVLVPLAPKQTAAEAFDFTSLACAMVAQLKPELVSLEAETAPRRGRLYLDCVQNYQGKTLVLPYSVRAVDGAPVSTPLEWAEVTTTLEPRAFTIRTMRARLDAKGDLFAPALRGETVLAPLIARLRGGG